MLRMLLFFALTIPAFGGHPPAGSGERFSEPAPPTQPAAKYSILARHNSGGWLNLDIKYDGDPLEAAKKCVRDHPDAAAVACFAFASEAARAASKPESAGNFAGSLCWDARWQKNKLGEQSGQENSFKDSDCP